MRRDWKPPAPKWQAALEFVGWVLAIAAVLWLLTL